MNLSRKIDILFLIAIVIFTGLFYVVFQSSKITRESSSLISQAHEILYQLEKVESSISAIEGAYRGYIISGKEYFLDPISSERKQIGSGLVVLDSLIGENQQQSTRLAKLSQFINRKIEISEQGINWRQQGNIESALGLVSSGKGKVLMDSIRMVSLELEREEIKSLNEKANLNEALVIAQNRDFIFFAAFILVVLLAFYIRVRKNAIKLLGYRKKQDELIEELNHQNRQLDDFAHLTSHNIRSPAVNIYTLISLLNEHSSLEDYKMIYEKLTKVSKNLNETLNELLEVLHVKSNKNIERQVVSFDSLFNKVKESMQGDIIKSKAEISGSFEEVPYINYPKSYLESIFYNLLSNAVKYRSPDRSPVVKVTSRRENGKIILEVSDNGLGIDMDRYGAQVFGLRKIFHTRTNAKGVGLFMTKTQVEALGGEINIKSEVDKGTTFTVVFDASSNTNIHSRVA